MQLESSVKVCLQACSVQKQEGEYVSRQNCFMFGWIEKIYTENSFHFVPLIQDTYF